MQDRHPYDLSGGEQQRAALAKLLLINPDILLLDEPKKGLDAQFKAEFAVILKSLANAGICIVIVSHDIEFCAQYADRCALFFDGSIVAEGAPDEFFCGNSFYTPSANRIPKELLPNAVTTGDVIEAIGGESKELFPTDAAEYRRQERTEEKPAEPSPLPLWQKIGAWIPGLVVLLHVYLCDQD